ncbi:Enkurin domain-containing protein 1 [Nowakowskiella sp. JEL0078]|nr:Enkurin domain-containing protein 1 [Nowakowskiella sp. JEL0078]
MSGAAVGQLLKPSRGLRDDIIFRGGKPKDHEKENYKRLKNIEKETKLKEMQASQPSPPPFKLSQFQNVASKLNTRSPSTSGTVTPSTSSSSQKNFIQVNAALSKLPKQLSQSSLNSNSSNTSSVISRKTKIGQIPKYLLDRKLKWAEEIEERERLMLQEKIPPGTILLIDEERIKALTLLRDAHSKSLTSLSRFPITVETPKYKRKRTELEQQILKLETLIAEYDKSVVYVFPNEHYEVIEFWAGKV